MGQQKHDCSFIIFPGCTARHRAQERYRNSEKTSGRREMITCCSENTMRVALGVEYNGNAFHGWERKPELRTVQGTLEDAIYNVCGQRVRTVAASRTDAGTHAIGQVVHFDVPRASFVRSGWEKALNSRLPSDINISRSGTCSSLQFDARASATWRRYRYTIHTASVPCVFMSGLTWYMRNAVLDENAMNAAARTLLEYHESRNLSAFRKAGSAASHTNIRVMDAKVVRSRSHILELEVKADWFVYGMMRLLTAALVEVGRGSWTIDEFRRVTEQRDRSAIKYSAPAAGLCLLEVGYPVEIIPFRKTSSEEDRAVVHLGLSDFVVLE